MTPTVMIMTLNEEMNIAGAMDSYPSGTPIVLYDSYSTDATVDIARARGAKIVQRKFDNWSAHQNWGAANIDFGSPWVIYADADERMTSGLWREICERVETPGDFAAFEMRRQDMFMGTWIKHSSFYPCWFVRLYRPDRVRWERLVNPVAIVAGKTGRLQGHFLHYPFSKGTAAWFERHIQYAEFESRELLSSRAEKIDWRRLIGGDPQDRRRQLKRLFYRMPARPAIKFMVLYLLRRGFLDGRAGYNYARMQAIYEVMIQLRIMEERRKARGEPV